MIKTDLPLGGSGGGGGGTITGGGTAGFIAKFTGASAIGNSLSETGAATIAITGVFDGGGSVITNNSITYLRIPYACTITAWSIIVDTGTCTIDVLKIANTDGGTLPVASITAAATPSIAAGNQHYSTTLTGWTTSIAALDVIAFKVTAISLATKASIALICTKT